MQYNFIEYGFLCINKIMSMLFTYEICIEEQVFPTLSVGNTCIHLCFICSWWKVISKWTSSSFKICSFKCSFLQVPKRLLHLILTFCLAIVPNIISFVVFQNFINSFIIKVLKYRILYLYFYHKRLIYVYLVNILVFHFRFLSGLFFVLKFLSQCLPKFIAHSN